MPSAPPPSPTSQFWLWMAILGPLYVFSWWMFYEIVFATPASSPTSTSTPAPPEWWKSKPFLVVLMILYGFVTYGVIMAQYLDAITKQNSTATQAEYADIYDYTTKEFRTPFYRVTYGWGLFSMIVAFIAFIFLCVVSGPRW